MSTNTDVADELRGIADLLDLMGERFKPEAYRRAARSVETLPEDIRKLVARGALDEVPGVGEAISEKIREYLQDGHIAYHERLKAEVPPGVVELMRVSGLGPKTARRFWSEMGIEGPAELRAAIDAGKLAGISGFGPKKIQNIRAALSTSTSSRRMPLQEAYELSERLVSALRSAPVDQLVVAGSLRRRRESIGDLDILATSKEPAKVLDAFVALPERTEVKLKGPTKVTIVVQGGVQVDLRVVDPGEFGAAWQYFTGSKDHNIELRSLAKDRGLRVNEYGVFRGEERIAGATEAEVYGAFGIPWIPPELREARGEISRSVAGTLPKVVDEADLRGDLHVHLDEVSHPAVEAAMRTAAKKGWEYLGLIPPTGGSEALRREIGSSGAPRVTVLVGEEVDAASTSAADPAVDYRVLRATGEPPSVDVAKSAPPARILAHLVTGPLGGLSDASVASAWTGFARARGAAVEMTARGAADGVDPDQGAAHIADGGRVHLAVRLGSPSERVLSVGLARRAGISAGQVLNAQPASSWRPPKPRGSGR